MKLSTPIINQFNMDQAEHGTKYALSEIYSRISYELMQRTKKSHVESFLADQEKVGTRQALYNTIHEAAEEILHGIGVRHIKTANAVFKKKGAVRVRMGDVDKQYGTFRNMSQE